MAPLGRQVSPCKKRRRESVRFEVGMRKTVHDRKQLSQLTIDKFSLPRLVAVAKDFREKCAAIRYQFNSSMRPSPMGQRPI